MSVEEDLLLLLVLMKLKRRRKRSVHVQRFLLQRNLKGIHAMQFSELKEEPKLFFQHYRMYPATFDILLEAIFDKIKKTDTTMRSSIPPDERLALTLRYLAGGSPMRDLHVIYRIGVSTVSQIIREVCQAIWDSMKSDCFPPLTRDLWLKVASEFLARSNFPHCIGAVDGKHIRVIKPSDSGSLNFNYKKFFSTLLMAICDANYKFLFIDVGSYGKEADSTVFQRSTFHRKLLDGSLNIPEPSDIGVGLEMKMPYVLVGDEGFGLSEFIMRPYAGKFFPLQKRIFNYRLTRARRYIECSFGILANKWRILHRPLDVNMDLANLIVKTCCLLHNFVRDRDGFKFRDTLTVEGLYDMAQNPVPGSKNATSTRTHFAEYFQTPQGSLPWQLKKVGEE